MRLENSSPPWPSRNGLENDDDDHHADDDYDKFRKPRLPSRAPCIVPMSMMVCESVLGLSCSLYTHEHKDPSRMETKLRQGFRDVRSLGCGRGIRKLCRGSVREYCSSSCPLCLLALGRKEGEGNNCWPRSLDQREGGTFFFFWGGGLQLNVSGLVFRICLCHEVLGTFGDHSEVWDVDLGDRIEHIVGSRLEDDIHMRTPSPVIVALHHVAASLRLGLCLSVPDRLRRVSVAFPASETQLPAT